MEQVVGNLSNLVMKRATTLLQGKTYAKKLRELQCNDSAKDVYFSKPIAPSDL